MIARADAFSIVRTLARFVKAVSYYEPGHPVLNQLQQELSREIARVASEDGVLLACAGRRILFARGEAPLHEPIAASLASHLLERSVVALRIFDYAPPEDLGALVRALGESAERLHNAGGVVALMGDTQGIGVVEVDLSQLYATGTASIEADHPLISEALKEVLRLKEGTAQGTALGVQLGDLGSPQSLGTFLDQLIERAEPALVADGSSSGSAGGMGARELARAASEAFVQTHDNIASSGAPASRDQVLESARILADVMERLSAEARFALLARLAGAEAKSEGWQSAVESLSSQVSNDLIVRTLTEILAKGSSDPEAVRTMGELIKQLRPVESDRRALLEQLDRSSGEHGIDGVLWQELQATATQRDGYGLLELPFRQTGPGLRSAAARRMDGEQTPVVQRAFETMDPLLRLTRSAAVMGRLITTDPEVTMGTVTAAGEILQGLERDDIDAPRAVSELLQALVLRADREASPNTPLARGVRQLLTGRRGPRYTTMLVRSIGIKAAIVTRAVFGALSGTITRADRDELIEALATLDTSALTNLRIRLPDESPPAVGGIVRALLTADVTQLAPVMRQALRNSDVDAKIAAVMALSRFPAEPTIRQLAVLAGCQGDEASARAYGVDVKQEETLRKVQEAAINALGRTRTEMAVAPLQQLLMRRVQAGLFGGGKDPLKVPAARALAANHTPMAKQVLAAASQSPDKLVREACEVAVRR